ncbi:MAG TPA: hypothetical protein DEG23_01155 [Coxiellaceae bacterium]|nr:hypothetical protein [Coxiellaceae bacterium]
MVGWLCKYKVQLYICTEKIFKNADQLVPIEIKAAATFHQDFLRGLDFFSDLVKARCNKKFLIYGGKQEQKIGMTKIFNYKNTAKLLKE